MLILVASALQMRMDRGFILRNGANLRTHLFQIDICYILKYQQNSLLKKLLPLKGRWIQKLSFLKTEGFSSRSKVYCSTIGLEPPPNFFLGKKFSSPFKRDSSLSFFCRILKFVYTILSIFFLYLLSGMPDRRYRIFVILP